MSYERTSHHANNIHRQHDDWDEVHNQLLSIQKKSLEVSNPDDAHEKEADEVAQKVVDGQSAEIHGSGSTINRKGEGSAETTPEFQSKLESSKGGGTSLDDSTKSEMESKMGADFSGVKIHTGSEAHTMNENVNAKAFTHLNDIYFRHGEFNTDSKQGKELLAHELVHTKQQEKEQQISRKPKTDPDVELDATAIAQQIHSALFNKGGSDDMMVLAALKDLNGNVEETKVMLHIYKKLFGEKLIKDISKYMATVWQPVANELLGENKKNDPKQIAVTPSETDEVTIQKNALSLKTAIENADSKTVITILLSYDRQPGPVKLLKKAYSDLKNVTVSDNDLNTKQSELEIDLGKKFKDSGSVLNYALFLLNGLPPTGDENKEYVKPSTGGVETKVPGGGIKSQKDISYEFGKDTQSHQPGEISAHGFSNSYIGGLSEESRWLQFVWREIIVYRGKKATPMLLNVGRYYSETNPEKPHYNIDGYPELKLPFYEGGKSKIGDVSTGGAHIRGKNETTVFDTPKSLYDLAPFLVEQALTKDDFKTVTSIESRAHLITYFIRHFAPYYKSSTDYTWVFSPQVTEDPAPSKVDQSTMAVDHLGETKGDIRGDMIAQDSQLSYIR